MNKYEKWLWERDAANRVMKERVALAEAAQAELNRRTADGNVDVCRENSWPMYWDYAKAFDGPFNRNGVER